jgi:hypothetical protein
LNRISGCWIITRSRSIGDDLGKIRCQVKEQGSKHFEVVRILDRAELIAKAKECEIESEKAVKSAIRKHKEFLKLYSYREHPEEIDLLTPDRIYNPGADDYFFLWIEHKLKELGHLRVGSALVWENARDNPEKLRELLRTAIDDNLSISSRVDLHWEDIKYFGGDKQIAKKIIYCYYPEECLPAYKTEDLERFGSELGLDYKRKSHETFGKSYEMLSIGQKFEQLNNLLLDFRDKMEEIKGWNNILFMYFLYRVFPSTKIPSSPRTEEPLHPLGLLFEPKNEQEIVYLFSVLHRDLDLPYIITLRSEFPDAVVMDKKRNIRTIEFEVRASSFIQHGHDKSGCDLIVCWENDLESEEELPQIIELKDFVKDL